MKNIYCIVGPSGSGKTTLVEILTQKYGYSAVQSYTTRQPRFEGETGYHFVSDEEFKSLGQMYAHTVFDGHEYGATAELIDQNDLYILDPAGASSLREKYDGRKGVVVVGLAIDQATVAQRMRLRGDPEEKIHRRLEHDKIVFEDLHLMADKMISVESSADEVAAYLHEWISCVENDVKKHEYAIYNDNGQIVSDGKQFYSLNDALWTLKLAKESYPDGLPEGWEIRDETQAMGARYVATIKRLRPSFKRSCIEVDAEKSARSYDGYLYVPFTYCGKAYEYRSYHGDEWIESRKVPLDERICKAVNQSKTCNRDAHYNRKESAHKEM